MLLLLLSTICVFFTGFQPIAICSWLQPFFLLHFLHKAHILDKTWVSRLAFLVFTVVAQSIATTLANLGIFHGLDEEAQSVVPSYVIVFGFSLVLWILLIIPFIISLMYRRRFEKASVAHPVVFAAAWTSAWFMWDHLSLTGTLGNHAHSQFGLQPIVMTASLWGLDGICFLMAWFSALIHEKLVVNETLRRKKLSLEISKSDRRRVLEMFNTQAKVFGGVFVLCMLYGSAWMMNGFFQKDLSRTVKPTVPVSCIVAGLNNEGSEALLDLTSQRVKAGDSLVIWSEAAVYVRGENAEKSLLARAGEVANQKAYVGITYEYFDEERQTVFNTFTLVRPNGSVGLRYRKTHPVPFVEAYTTPGSMEMPVIDTEYGRIGAAICFDFQFPDFLRQAGEKRVDIMLEPAETSGPIGRHLYEADSFRAVENGFTWFKCSSVGMSVVANAVNQVFDYREATTSTVLLMQLPRSKRVWTVYSSFGFMFGWIICGITIVHLLLLLNARNSLIHISPSWMVLYFTGETTSRNPLI